MLAGEMLELAEMFASEPDHHKLYNKVKTFISILEGNRMSDLLRESEGRDRYKAALEEIGKLGRLDIDRAARIAQAALNPNSTKGEGK